MGASLRYSFADPRQARFGYGAAEDGAVLLDGDGARAIEAVETVGADTDAGRFEFRAGGALDASFEPLGPAISFDGGARTEWLCRVSGTMRAGSGDLPLDGYGHDVREEHELDRGLVLTRSVWVCIGDDFGVVLGAVRPRGARGHGAEAIEAYVGRGTPLVAGAVAEPLLSSTYDGAGGLVRCGLELWESEDEDARALRVGGEVVATSAEPSARGGDAGVLARSMAFMACRHAGRTGVGCYGITRYAE